MFLCNQSHTSRGLDLLLGATRFRILTRIFRPQWHNRALRAGVAMIELKRLGIDYCLSPEPGLRPALAMLERPR